MSGKMKIPVGHDRFAYVDNEDYRYINSFKWCSRKQGRTFYARRQVKTERGKRAMEMHRFIMNPGPGLEIDHIDGNGLNNSRSNLRIVTHAQNAMNRTISKNNTSGFKGVSWHRVAKKWRSSIGFMGKSIIIGMFDSRIDAANAYKQAEIKYFGEFRRKCQWYSDNERDQQAGRCRYCGGTWEAHEG